MTIKNGDLPAMPITSEPYPFGAIPRNSCVGLTKREQLAMAAMQGILANQAVNFASSELATAVSSSAIQCADALLAELERTK